MYVIASRGNCGGAVDNMFVQVAPNNNHYNFLM
ncbi:hypothetical protein EM595_1355 [Duffyella gerundensis]|uniref:Uncharacterized protein n=1 Tax=Duffyella gerundensis TaxID=1619313 RepID=A0A0U5L3G3_9GAMM|nr:hypothetical protein EM595_1355 [Duffyella gerundensis]